jgi:thiol:disulfide interchange protein DsbA
MIAKRAITALFGFALLMGAALAPAAAPPVQNKEYMLADPPQPPLDASSNGKRIEVIEFFYYGCPHCYNLQPALKTWLKNAPKDVEFRRMPTVFQKSWLPLTRAYYALEAVGAIEKVHDAVFEAVHKQSIHFSEKNILLEWAAKKGIDAKKLGEAYDSFAVQTKTQRAVQLTRAYGISGTPSVVVAGRYLTQPSMTMNADNSINYQRFNEVLTGLVEMARAASGAKKS